MTGDEQELSDVDSDSDKESFVTAKTRFDVESKIPKERLEQYLQQNQPTGSPSEKGASEQASLACTGTISTKASIAPRRSSETSMSPTSNASESPKDQDSNRPFSVNSLHSNPDRTNSLSQLNTGPLEAQDQTLGHIRNRLVVASAPTISGNRTDSFTASPARSSAASAPTPTPCAAATVDVPIIAQAAPAITQTTTTEHSPRRTSPPPKACLGGAEIEVQRGSMPLHEEEEHEGGWTGAAAAPVTPPAAAQRPSSPAGESVQSGAGSARSISMLSEGLPLPLAEQGQVGKWPLLMEMLERYSLSISDVSPPQVDEFIRVPLDDSERYFETHMLEDLRRNKLEKASRKAVMAGPSQLSEEESVAMHRAEAYRRLVGEDEGADEGDTPEGLSAEQKANERSESRMPPGAEHDGNAKDLENGPPSEMQQASSPQPNMGAWGKPEGKFKWAVCILTVLTCLGLSLGLGIGLTRH